MIEGIGLDIVELDRVQKIIKRQPKFIHRILTPNEQKVYEQRSATRRIEFAAGRFAAKEAFAKAVGTGIGRNLSFQDIEIKADDNGKPFICAPFSQGVHLSITHSRDFAAAQVIIEK